MRIILAALTVLSLATALPARVYGRGRTAAALSPGTQSAISLRADGRIPAAFLCAGQSPGRFRARSLVQSALMAPT